MTELSPAARSVFESFNSKFEWVEDGVPGPQFKAIAAALRAVAEQGATFYWDGCPVQAVTVGSLLTIADQLEAS